MARQVIRIDRNQFNRVPSRHRPSIERALLQAAELLLDRVQKDLSRPYRKNASKPGDPPRMRTGRLRNSYSIRKIGSGEIAIQSNTGRSDMMEKGAKATTIFPVTAKALLIPVTAAQARAIAVRMNRQRNGRNKRRGRRRGKARDYLKAAGAIKIGGQIYLLRKYARRGAIEPRPHLRPAAARMRPAIERLINKALANAAKVETRRMDVAAKGLITNNDAFTRTLEELYGQQFRS